MDGRVGDVGQGYSTLLSFVRPWILSPAPRKRKKISKRMETMLILYFLMGWAGAERTSVMSQGHAPHRGRYACARTAASLPEVKGLQ